MHTVFVHGSAPTAARSETRAGAAEARTLSLDAPFDRVGVAGSCDEVSLAPLANRLEMRELRRFLHRASYLLREGGRVRFVTRDPDEYPESAWPGERVDFAGTPEHVRPLRHTLELLRLHPFRVRTPVAIEASGDDGLPPGRYLHWTALRVSASPSDESNVSLEERYAPTRTYRRFDRLEEPETADDLFYAASRLRPQPGDAVLALGVND